MDMDNYDYLKPKVKETGSHDVFNDEKSIVYPFGKYEIIIKLTADNEFIGVIEVKINKDFLSYKHKSRLKGYHDVDDYYKE